MINSVIQDVTIKSPEIYEHGSGVCDNCATCLAKLYNGTAREEYNNFCPLTEKEIVLKGHPPFFNMEPLGVKREKKKKERLWRRLKTDEARRAYQEGKYTENRLVIKRKREYYQNKVLEAGSNINKLYKMIDSFTGKKVNRLLGGFSNDVLANMFLEYFYKKIEKVIRNFKTDGYYRPAQEIPVPENKLTIFQRVDGVKTIVHRVKLT